VVDTLHSAQHAQPKPASTALDTVNMKKSTFAIRRMALPNCTRRQHRRLQCTCRCPLNATVKSAEERHSSLQKARKSRFFAHSAGDCERAQERNNTRFKAEHLYTLLNSGKHEIHNPQLEERSGKLDSAIHQPSMLHDSTSAHHSAAS
jgi:hypothetical protein